MNATAPFAVPAGLTYNGVQFGKLHLWTLDDLGTTVTLKIADATEQNLLALVASKRQEYAHAQ